MSDLIGTMSLNTVFFYFEGIPNWNEFLEYMKVCNFMCNNCLDYFPEKPWFSSSYLVMVDVGCGDLLYINVPHMTFPRPCL